MKILTYDLIRNKYWFQTGPRSYQVGQLLSPTTLETLLKNAKSEGAVVLDITDVPPDAMKRMITKFFNRQGTVDEPEEFAEALRLNDAKEII